MWFPLRFPHKNEVRFVFTSKLYVGRHMSCLSYLCSGVQCCCVVFLFLFFFVLCARCCQFLWIVLFWMPLKYSLTFIYYTYQHYCNNDSNECQLDISSLKSSYLMGIPRTNFPFPLWVTIKWKQINILNGYAYPVSEIDIS